MVTFHAGMFFELRTLLRAVWPRHMSLVNTSLTWAAMHPSRPSYALKQKLRSEAWRAQPN